MKSGVYQIRNLVTNKIYVGSAINLIGRKHTHFSFLRKNKHSSPKLQNSFNKHKQKNFVFEVLEEVVDKTKLIEREQFYLDSLKPKYNCRTRAESNLGLKHRSESFIKRRKKIYQFDPSTLQLIKVWSSLKEVADELKLSMGNLTMACQQKLFLTLGGYIWRHECNKDNLQAIIPKKRQLPLSVVKICKNTNKVLQTYKSISDAARAVKTDTTHICAVLSGRLKVARGFGWEYAAIDN